MGKLAKVLEYYYAGGAERKEIIKRPSFANSFNENEKKMLLQSEAESVSESTLIGTEVLGAIVEGAKSRESARKALPIINTTTNKSKIMYGASPSGQYAPYVAEGASIPIETIQYTSGSATMKKAAIRPAVTQDLIDDCQFDIVEMELKKAGAKLENKLNQEVITTLLDGVDGPADVDPGGTYISMVDIGIAKGEVDSFGWMADSVLLHPAGFGWLLDDTNLGDITSGGDNKIGLNFNTLDAIVDTKISSKYWDAVDGASHYCGLVFDSYNFAAIIMREDINISKFDDPIHDLVHPVIKMRFDVVVFNADAGCRILTQ